ncbi:MAG: hypothetical protein NT029_08155 [Armatimonadetes bacterium]|nr:hypothetical protein [Armatimonadota bacterium]
MATLEKSTDRTLITEGEHWLKFHGYEVKRITSSFPDNKVADGKADVLIVSFISSTTDANGVNEDMDVLLPPKISPANATGRFFRTLSPQLDLEKDDVDPDDYIGRVYKAMVIHETTVAGKTRPRIVKATERKNGTSAPKPPPPPAPAFDGTDDPFGDD